jgi:hypothetical protein
MPIQVVVGILGCMGGSAAMMSMLKSEWHMAIWRVETVAARVRV